MDDDDLTLAFLADMGIQANIVVDDQGNKLIAISTEQYQRRRAWGESWSILLAQDETYGYFHARLRCTGNTL